MEPLPACPNAVVTPWCGTARIVCFVPLWGQFGGVGGAFGDRPPPRPRPSKICWKAQRKRLNLDLSEEAYRLLQPLAEESDKNHVGDFADGVVAV